MNDNDNYNNKNFPIDIEKYDKLWRIFYYNNPIFNIGFNFLYNHIFKNDFDLIWCDLISIINKENNNKYNEEINVLKLSLEYKYIYGMCPFYFSKERLLIPSQQSGYFYVQSKNIVFRMRNSKRKFCHVYIWNSLFTKNEFTTLVQFKSPLMSLYGTIIKYKQLEIYSDFADEFSSKPLIFLEKEKDKRTLSERTEQENYGNFFDSDQLPPEQNSILFMQDFDSHLFKRHKQTLLEDVSIGQKNLIENEINNKYEYQNKTKLLIDNILELPDGFHYKTTPQYKINRDIIKEREYLDEKILLSMGISNTILDEKMNINYTKNEQISKNRVKDLVIQYRKYLNDFIKYTYEVNFRKQDNEKLRFLIKKIESLKLKGKSNELYEEIQLKCKLCLEKNDLVELRFEQNANISYEELNLLYTNKVISEEEFISNARQFFLFDNREDEKEILKVGKNLKIRELLSELLLKYNKKNNL